MSNAMTAGAEIRRGDMVKLVAGELFPTLLFERYFGAAAEGIPAGTRAYSDRQGAWRIVPPG
ncbi:hypothetical protein XI05_07150 [Bradyrhizobium sp. CCBAU 11357]|nr:hypothetical protein [Bradyrhizobium sp. CCBAU 11357]